MPGPVEHRSVTPLINFIRDVCRGKKIISSLRYTDDQSKRTQPPPNIPDGPYQKTSQIYYYTRDARREVKPPMLIGGIKQIDTEKKSLVEKKFLTPGKTYNWSS